MIFFSSSRKSRLVPILLIFILIGSALLAGCRRTPADFIARGKRLVQDKHYDRALLEFKNAAALEPRNAEPYYQIALAYLAMGQGQAAVNNLLHARQVDPKHLGVQLKLAELMAINQDRAIVQEAETRARSLMIAQPRNSDAANALALAEFRLGKTEAALAHFRQALAESPAEITSASILPWRNLQRAIRQALRVRYAKPRLEILRVRKQNWLSAAISRCRSRVRSSNANFSGP